MKLVLRLVLLLGLGLSVAPVGAASPPNYWACYAPVGVARQVPDPDPAAALNCLLPDNEGGYVAVWDDTTNSLAVIEARDATSTQLWQQSVAMSAGENSRLVLSSTNRILWCSALQWVFLDRNQGTVVATGTWNEPGLDPSKVVVQNDVVYVINNAIASMFDTSMNSLGAVTALPPQGLWRSYGGAWLVDSTQRTGYFIPIASIANGAQTQIPFPAATGGGFVEHHVLGANTNSLFVLSSINWQTNTTHFLTLCNSSGILFQEQFSFNEAVTGVSCLPDGWLISTMSLGQTYASSYLYKVDSAGSIYPHLLISPAKAGTYIALNTSPPQLAHLIGPNQVEIFNVTQAPWWQWWFGGGTLVSPNVNVLQSAQASFPIGGTNYFWMNSTLPCNR